MPRKYAVLAVLTLAIVALSAAVAWAHHVTSVAVVCTPPHATLTYDSTQGTTLSGNVLVNGKATPFSVVAGQNGVPVSGTLSVPYTPPVGQFTVAVQWQFSSGESGTSAPVTLTCSEAPAPTPPVSAPTPPASSPAPPVPAATPPATTPAPRTPPKSDTTSTRRFGVPGHPTKKCTHGRRHLKDSHGRRFTVCRKHAKPPVTRRPQFTG